MMTPLEKLMFLIAVAVLVFVYVLCFEKARAEIKGFWMISGKDDFITLGFVPFVSTISILLWEIDKYLVENMPIEQRRVK